jgi:S1-C subfamily serine protease
MPNLNGNSQSLNGARITQVISDGPAYKAGLQPGDVILAVDGQEVNADNPLGDLIQQYQPNDTVQLSIQKADASEASDVQVTLGENPDTPGKAYLGIYYASGQGQNGRIPFFQNPQNPGNGDNGQTQPFGGQPFGQMLPELPNGVSQAVVVNEVITGTPAADAGLQAGDIITAIDGSPVNDAQTLVDAVSAHKPGDQVTLTVYRSGQSDTQTVSITLGENPDRAGAAYMGVSIGTISSGLPENHPPILPMPTPDNNGSTTPNLPGGGDA